MYKIVVIGNLGGKPEGRDVNDRHLCTFNLAVTRTVKGEKITEWCRVTAWENTARICEKYLDKGSKVCVMGRPEPHAWIDNTGHARGSIEITADEVEFVGAKRDGMSESEEPAPFEE